MEQIAPFELERWFAAQTPRARIDLAGSGAPPLRLPELLALATVSDPRWPAVANRDPQADGRFFYSVRTTGATGRPAAAAAFAKRSQRARSRWDRNTSW